MHTDHPYHPNEAEKSLPHHDMIFVKGGEFMMGDDESGNADEKPAHRVQVNDFYMARYPVTQRLWEMVVGDTPSRFEGDRRPVERVSWDDAQAFIKKLNVFTQRQYRLPTEAEWEYAARGGALSEGYQFAGSDKLKQVGWYTENSSGETHEVGQKYPNELGLCDMSGNVWEWVEDDWHGSYKDAPKDGSAWIKPGSRGSNRVLRGGGWFNYAQNCRAASRTFYGPDIRNNIVGFRLVLSLQSVG